MAAHRNNDINIYPIQTRFSCWFQPFLVFHFYAIWLNVFRWVYSQDMKEEYDFKASKMY